MHDWIKRKHTITIIWLTHQARGKIGEDPMWIKRRKTIPKLS